MSGSSLEILPQPIIIYDRTFRLLRLHCSVLLSNIIRKWSPLPLVNTGVSWQDAGPWLAWSQFYWVTLRKWSLLLCLQTREGFPSPWNTNIAVQHSDSVGETSWPSSGIFHPLGLIARWKVFWWYWKSFGWGSGEAECVSKLELSGHSLKYSKTVIPAVKLPGIS